MSMMYIHSYLHLNKKVYRIRIRLYILFCFNLYSNSNTISYKNAEDLYVYDILIGQKKGKKDWKTRS